MTEHEKIALIKAGISTRHNDYQRVKEIKEKPLRYIETQTGFSVYFITKCRKIAGLERRKSGG